MFTSHLRTSILSWARTACGSITARAKTGIGPRLTVLFRTAARCHGKQVTGVLLSGILDDGAAGIWAVQQAGGLTIVQDPQDAAHPDMPLAALEWIRPDRVLPAAKIGAQIAAWAANGRSSEHGAESSAQESEHAMASQENIEAESDARISGRPSPIACPECHGVLWEVESLPKPMFRCRVGHSYSLETLNCELSLATEGALWASLRILSEKPPSLTAWPAGKAVRAFVI